MPTWSSCKKQNSSWRQLLLRNLMLPWSRKTSSKWNASSRSSPCWACMMRGWVTSPDTFASRWAPCKCGGEQQHLCCWEDFWLLCTLSVWWMDRWKRSGGPASFHPRWIGKGQTEAGVLWGTKWNPITHWFHLASMLLQGLLQFPR